MNRHETLSMALSGLLKSYNSILDWVEDNDMKPARCP